ncbi:NAD-dependent epimerase/dehydratase family protein [Pseudomonas sp. NPDC090202]|uniref:NAD-dependent epimerase/dehydratase family protein n=1 Tax=unclassified Pseudomonas TaxID=196821 RepID=UPI0038062C26
MSERIFLAGATGVIGRVLVKLLVEAGHSVYGTTRREERRQQLQDAGAIPVVVDVLDAAWLRSELQAIRPTCVIHQLTDLPRGLDPAQMSEAVVRNARVREQGTAHLVEAALAVDCRRFVAQSIAWAYALGTPPYREVDALDIDAEGLRRVSVGGVRALEQSVLEAPMGQGVVLRYGQLYGPGTGADQPGGSSPVHVEAAAWAAVLAMQSNLSGIFNIVEDDTQVSNAKARQLLGWLPGWRFQQRNGR